MLCQLVQPFGSYSRFLYFWPHNPPPPNAPWGIEGLIVWSLCPFPDESAGMYQMLCQLVHPFDRYSRFLNFWPPKTPQNSPWGIDGLIVFSLCPFPDESAGVYQMLCQLVHPFDSYSRFLNFWPPKTPQNAPWVIEGLLFLAYVHPQMNPQACTKFGANWSTCLVFIPDFWISDPLKPPKPPLGNTGLIFIELTTIRRWICMCVPNLVPIGPQATTCIASEGYTHRHTDTHTHTHTHSHSPIRCRCLPR